MARRIIWSKRAQEDRKGIFSYWNKRNKSTVYSRKLNKLYNEAAEFVAENPNTGRVTKRKGIRVKFLSHFELIYKISTKEIQLLAIFDTRQDPEKFKKIIGE
jgi:plasmid stabilization system protein ParE